MRLPAIAVLGCLFMAGTGHAQYAKPVIVDSTGAYELKVHPTQVNKKGWPWGWVPKIEVYVGFDGREDVDLVTIQNFKGRKKWGKPIKCKSGRWYKKANYGSFECRMDEKLAINKAGVFSFKATFKQTVQGKTHDMGERIYKIAKYKADQHVVKKRWIPSMKFVADADFRVPQATFSVNWGRYPSDAPYVMIRSWIKWEGTGSFDPKPIMYCYYKDKKVANRNGNQRARVEIDWYKKKGGEVINTNWWQYTFYMNDLKYLEPKTRSSGVSWPKAHWTHKNPGEYKCVIMSQGDVLREIYFTIGADGKIVRPPCQDMTKPGALVMPPFVSVLRQVLKKGNAKFDKKAWKKMGFNRKKWSAGCPLK